VDFGEYDKFHHYELIEFRGCPWEEDMIDDETYYPPFLLYAGKKIILSPAQWEELWDITDMASNRSLPTTQAIIKNFLISHRLFGES
jgi:hypothetical protein